MSVLSFELKLIKNPLRNYKRSRESSTHTSKAAHLSSSLSQPARHALIGINLISYQFFPISPIRLMAHRNTHSHKSVSSESEASNEATISLFYTALHLCLVSCVLSYTSAKTDTHKSMQFTRGDTGSRLSQIDTTATTFHTTPEVGTGSSSSSTMLLLYFMRPTLRAEDTAMLCFLHRSTLDGFTPPENPFGLKTQWHCFYSARKKKKEMVHPLPITLSHSIVSRTCILVLTRCKQ